MLMVADWNDLTLDELAAELLDEEWPRIELELAFDAYADGWDRQRGRGRYAGDDPTLGHGDAHGREKAPVRSDGEGRQARRPSRTAG